MSPKMQMLERMRANPPRVNVEEVKPRIAELAAKHKISMVVLFGSQVSGRFHEESDIDIAVMPERPAKFDSMELWSDLAQTFHTDRIDIINLKSSDPLLAWNVARGGKLLFAPSSDDWNLFRIRAMKEYDDVRRFDKLRRRALDMALRRWGVLK